MIVMTGGTRGLGAVAAGQLKADRRRIMAVRGQGRPPMGWEPLPLDLASLASVRAFAASLPADPITHLILNAGGQRSNASTRTCDGFETTFATNHLAHYLLLRLTMPRLAPGARIVITTSGTHDPREKTGVPAPRHANAEWLAYPERDPHGDKVAAIAGMRAYAASKLCNLMTTRFLAASESARANGWSVYSYDPGLTPGTALVRDQSWIVRALVWPVLPLVVPLSKGMNTMANAGRGLADVATIAKAPAGCLYAALRKGQLTWPSPSDIACNDVAVQALWNDSAALVEYS